MANQSKALVKLVEDLSPELQESVREFVEFLYLQKRPSTWAWSSDAEFLIIFYLLVKYMETKSSTPLDWATFTETLRSRLEYRSRRKPTFGWAGALSDLRDQYTSVELQHQVSEWRIK